MNVKCLLWKVSSITVFWHGSVDTVQWNTVKADCVHVWQQLNCTCKGNFSSDKIYHCMESYLSLWMSLTYTCSTVSHAQNVAHGLCFTIPDPVIYMLGKGGLTIWLTSSCVPFCSMSKFYSICYQRKERYIVSSYSYIFKVPSSSGSGLYWKINYHLL